MKITYDWLKDHLQTKNSENQLLDKLTDIGLEVEQVENTSADLHNFIVAKIIKTEKHPNADRLKVCNVDIGEKKLIKVVCGAENAKENLITIYASPGAIIPKNKMEITVSQIRGITSYGMLCSESELNLSEESEGIIELNSSKFNKRIGKKYFTNNTSNLIDLSITPNRPDCLGVRGIARDLATAGFGKFKINKPDKIKLSGKQKIEVKILKEKDQGCTAFGSCLITNVKNTESPKWLKDKLISVGQKPISAIVDITNYVMLDLNRPLHAYDADKINKGIIVRNAKKGESFKALDNSEYKLDEGMCVISDKTGVLGLGGIIGGIRSGTEFHTKNVLIESAYFNSRSIRKTSKILNIDTDAKFRFERGIDPLSIEEGLIKSAKLIKDICGGEISKIDIQKTAKYKETNIKFEIEADPRSESFNSFEGLHTANPTLYAYYVDDIGNPISIVSHAYSGLLNSEIDSLLDLPGAYQEENVIYHPVYEIEEHEIKFLDDDAGTFSSFDHWTDFMSGTRMRFLNPIREYGWTKEKYINFSNLGNIQFYDLEGESNNIVPIIGETYSPMDANQNLSSRIWYAMKFNYDSSTDTFDARPPYTYRIEFSKECCRFRFGFR